MRRTERETCGEALSSPVVCCVVETYIFLRGEGRGKEGGYSRVRNEHNATKPPDESHQNKHKHNHFKLTSPPHNLVTSSFLLFALGKWSQPVHEDIGDKSVFTFMALSEKEQQRTLAERKSID